MKITKSKFQNLDSNKGISLYLALMVMTILLSVSLGLSSIFIGQVKMIREMGNSVIAFCAADAGIERVLYEDRDDPSPVSDNLRNGATYQVFVTATGFGDCLAEYFCIRSVGTYKETRRAIEIIY